MILEVAILDVRSGSEEAFEAAFAEARPLIASIEGFIALELLRCLEKPSRYNTRSGTESRGNYSCWEITRP